MKKLLFVYGTLKQGHIRNKYLAGQRYLGTAALKPTYRMVVLGGYPALVPPQEGDEGNKVRGELWEVDSQCLQTLDGIEGCPTLFVRKKLEMDSVFLAMLPTDPAVFASIEKNETDGYVYNQDVGHARDCGCFWF